MTTSPFDAAVAAVSGRPDGCVRAPGRVNVIGDHTDYQDGFCLPMAIDREAVVAWRRTGENVVAHSANLHDTVVVDLAAHDAPVEGWGAQVAATITALREVAIDVVPTEVAVASSVPLGSGLSSSAAFGVALARALADSAGTTLEGSALARVAQRAEHLVGVPCGLLDQLASVHGRAGHVLLLDCRDLSVEALPLPDGLVLLVAHCGLPRALADSEYAQRRAACEDAARRLGVATLRDADAESVADDRRARHVVSENRRVLAFADALRCGSSDALGPLMLESHRSLAQDFEVSTPELDLLVETFVGAGALGARMTGGGFGGCVVALAASDDARHVLSTTTQRYRAATGLDSLAFVAHAAPGASTIDVTTADHPDQEHT